MAWGLTSDIEKRFISDSTGDVQRNIWSLFCARECGGGTMCWGGGRWLYMAFIGLIFEDAYVEWRIERLVGELSGCCEIMDGIISFYA